MGLYALLRKNTPCWSSSIIRGNHFRQSTPNGEFPIIYMMKLQNSVSMLGIYSAPQLLRLALRDALSAVLVQSRECSLSFPWDDKSLHRTRGMQEPNHCSPIHGSLRCPPSEPCIAQYLQLT